MTITRGYSFTPTEIVTSEKLYQLVANAQFTAINWGSLLVSGGALPQTTTASGATLPGTIFAGYEPQVGLSGSTWSGQWSYYQMFIVGPQGPTALFRENGIEAKIMRSFVEGRYAGATVQCLDRSTGVTLAGNFDTGTNTSFGPWRNDRTNILGTVAGATTSSSPTSYNTYPRFVMFGLATVALDGVNIAHTAHLPAYIAHTNVIGQSGNWASSCVTNGFSVKGFLLERKDGTGSLAWMLCSNQVCRSG